MILLMIYDIFMIFDSFSTQQNVQNISFQYYNIQIVLIYILLICRVILNHIGSLNHDCTIKGNAIVKD